MANFDPQLITGGGQPTLTQAPSQGSGLGARVNVGTMQDHHGLIAIILFATLTLLILDKLGFRFAVAVGKR